MTGRPAAKERGVGLQDGPVSLQTGGLRPVFTTGFFFPMMGPCCFGGLSFPGPCLLGEKHRLACI